MTVAAARMGARLTSPFARGADTLQLRLVAGGDPGRAAIAPYLERVRGQRTFSFLEHRARYGVEPDPRYIVVCRRDVAVETTVTVRVTTGRGGTTAGAVTFPAGTRAGASLVVPVPIGAAPGPQLTGLEVAPAGAGGNAAEDWTLVALLGTMAKLLWVIGAERDGILRQLDVVAAQRSGATARGRSLDLLGNDLGVPRFPALPYGFDAATIALLHLDDRRDPPPGQPDAADALAAHPGHGEPHHAKNVGGAAEAGLPGRFGTAFAFRAPTAELRIEPHADFAIAASGSFTVEAFVQPDARAKGHLVSRQVRPGAPESAGWALTLGEFGRGLEANLRWLVSDGDAARAVRLFADRSLGTDRFQHVAGVIDRSASPPEARLYLDGRLRARSPLGELGAIVNEEPIRIGRHDGDGAAAVIDELRLSRVARERFEPVLGEGDAAYRRRLRLFERWTLPTPGNLQTALNEAIDEIAGDPDPLVVSDAAAPIASGAVPLRVAPGPLPPGGRIDALGRRRVSEEEACGPIAEHERGLDPAWLVTPEHERLAPPAPPMQAAARRRLLALLDGLADVEGRLAVRPAFVPGAGDLRTVGRGLLLAHSSLGAGELAARAHVAGFDFAEHRAQARAAYASVRAGDLLAIAATPAGAPGTPFDLRVGDVVTLSAEPGPPGDAVVDWSAVRGGAGRLALDGPRDRPTVRVRALAAGEVTVLVEVRRRAAFAAGTRTLRVGPQPLADGVSIAADGRVGVEPSLADDLVPPFFHPVHLVHVADARIGFGPGVDTHRMQAGVARPLGRLAVLVPGLRVLAAHERGPDAAAERGRRLLLAASVPAGELAAQAHGAGFSYVARHGDRVEVRQCEEALLRLESLDGVMEGDTVQVDLAQRAAPMAAVATDAAVYVASDRTDSVSVLDPATGVVHRAFKIGHRPEALAVDTVAGRLYTADSGSDSASVVELAGGDVRQLATGRKPTAIVHHAALQRLFVGCEGERAVRVLDAGSGATIASVPVGAGRIRLALTADGRRVLAVTASARELRVIAVDPPALSATLTLAGVPGDVAVARAGRAGWITLPAAGRVALLDQGGRGAAPRVTGEVELPPATAPGEPTGLGELAAVAGRTAAWVLDRKGETSRALLLDATGAALTQLSVTGGLRIAAGPEERAYVLTGGGDVAVLARAGDAFATVATWRLGSGLGEEIRWLARPLGEGEVRVHTPSRPRGLLTAERAGPVLVSAVYAHGDRTPPYAVEVRLKEELERSEPVIRKDQYDLIMNVLNLLHPIGVEIRTKPIRDRVVEVREQQLDAFPDYTYPKFRVPGPPPATPPMEG
jgi:DNA-binding beta-propeller fold protein YncE